MLLLPPVLSLAEMLLPPVRTLSLSLSLSLSL
jgi:hypothetical protein